MPVLKQRKELNLSKISIWYSENMHIYSVQYTSYATTWSDHSVQFLHVFWQLNHSDSPSFKVNKFIYWCLTSFVSPINFPIANWFVSLTRRNRHWFTLTFWSHFIKLKIIQRIFTKKELISAKVLTYTHLMSFN